MIYQKYCDPRVTITSVIMTFVSVSVTCACVAQDTDIPAYLRYMPPNLNTFMM